MLAGEQVRHLWQLLTGSSRKPGFGVKFARNSAGAMGTRTDGRLRQDDEQPYSAGVLITLCALQVCRERHHMVE